LNAFQQYFIKLSKIQVKSYRTIYIAIKANTSDHCKHIGEERLHCKCDTSSTVMNDVTEYVPTARLSKNCFQRHHSEIFSLFVCQVALQSEQTVPNMSNWRCWMYKSYSTTNNYRKTFAGWKKSL